MNSSKQSQPGTNALRAISQLMEDVREDMPLADLRKQLEKTGFDVSELRKGISAAVQEAKGMAELAQAKAKRLSVLEKAKNLLARLPKVPDPRAAIRELLDRAAPENPQFAVQWRGKLDGTTDSELESLLQDITLAEMLDEDSADNS